jgi:hypothetical protein
VTRPAAARPASESGQPPSRAIRPGREAGQRVTGAVLWRRLDRLEARLRLVGTKLDAALDALRRIERGEARLARRPPGDAA